MSSESDVSAPPSPQKPKTPFEIARERKLAWLRANHEAPKISKMPENGVIDLSVYDNEGPSCSSHNVVEPKDSTDGVMLFNRLSSIPSAPEIKKPTIESIKAELAVKMAEKRNIDRCRRRRQFMEDNELLDTVAPTATYSSSNDDSDDADDEEEVEAEGGEAEENLATDLNEDADGSTDGNEPSTCTQDGELLDEEQDMSLVNTFSNGLQFRSQSQLSENALPTSNHASLNNQSEVPSQPCDGDSYDPNYNPYEEGVQQVSEEAPEKHIVHEIPPGFRFADKSVDSFPNSGHSNLKSNAGSQAASSQKDNEDSYDPNFNPFEEGGEESLDRVKEKHVVHNLRPEDMFSLFQSQFIEVDRESSGYGIPSDFADPTASQNYDEADRQADYEYEQKYQGYMFMEVMDTALFSDMHRIVDSEAMYCGLVEVHQQMEDGPSMFQILNSLERAVRLGRRKRHREITSDDEEELPQKKFLIDDEEDIFQIDDDDTASRQPSRVYIEDEDSEEEKEKEEPTQHNAVLSRLKWVDDSDVEDDLFLPQKAEQNVGVSEAPLPSNVIEDEAELSGSDVENDIDAEDENEPNEYAEEEGDKDLLPHEDEIRDQNQRIDLKMQRDEDDRFMERVKDNMGIIDDTNISRWDRSFRYRLRAKNDVDFMALKRDDSEDEDDDQDDPVIPVSALVAAEERPADSDRLQKVLQIAQEPQQKNNSGEGASGGRSRNRNAQSCRNSMRYTYM